MGEEIRLRDIVAPEQDVGTPYLTIWQGLKVAAEVDATYEDDDKTKTWATRAGIDEGKIRPLLMSFRVLITEEDNPKAILGKKEFMRRVILAMARRILLDDGIQWARV